MIAQMLKFRIAPDNLKPQLAQGTVLLIAAIIFVAGFRKIAKLELTGTQMFLGLALTRATSLTELLSLGHALAET